MRAYLKNYRQAPRKVRLVADLIRGKRVGDALAQLSFTTKKAAPQLKKLLESAVANAKQEGVSHADDLRIKEIRVDKGFTFTRFRARFGGRATPINKESSHVTISLGEPSKTNRKRSAASGEQSEKPKVVSSKS